MAGHYAPRKKTHDNKAFYSTFGRPNSALPLKENNLFFKTDFISAYTKGNIYNIYLMYIIEIIMSYFCMIFFSLISFKGKKTEGENS